MSTLRGQVKCSLVRKPLEGEVKEAVRRAQAILEAAAHEAAALLEALPPFELALHVEWEPKVHPAQRIGTIDVRALPRRGAPALEAPSSSVDVQHDVDTLARIREVLTSYRSRVARRGEEGNPAAGYALAVKALEAIEALLVKPKSGAPGG